MLQVNAARGRIKESDDSAEPKTKPVFRHGLFLLLACSRSRETSDPNYDKFRGGGLKPCRMEVCTKFASCIDDNDYETLSCRRHCAGALQVVNRKRSPRNNVSSDTMNTDGPPTGVWREDQSMETLHSSDIAFGNGWPGLRWTGRSAAIPGW